MRKCSFLITIILIFSFFVPTTANAVSFVPNVDVYSQAVYMVNLDKNEVVYKKNENLPMSPASLTKIMTAILVLEKFKDNPAAMQTTLISAPSVAFDDVYLADASNADFRANEQISYSDLMYGLMLKSACEAGNIIAYNMGNGDIPSFVKMMNAKAKELGATNTTFTNPHGLYSETQRTTAHDMAIITQYAMSLPKFMEISCSLSHEFAATNKHAAPRTYKHTNLMLEPTSNYYYPYAKGIKTGTLDEGGRCLITTAEKNGYKYLLVTLNAPLKDAKGNNVFYNFIDHKNIYEWAFKSLSYQKVVDKQKELGEVEVRYGKDVSHVNAVPDQDYTSLCANPDDINKVPILKENIIAPVKAGDKLGTMELQYNGETFATIDLVASSNVKRNEFKYRLTVAKNFFSSRQFKTAIFISIGILVLYTMLYIFLLSKKKRRRTFKRSPRKRLR